MKNLKMTLAPGSQRCLFLVFLFLALACLLLVAGDGEARIIYVDDDGGVDGDGTPEAPFQKIQDAVDASKDGDTVLVAEGHYREHVIINRTLEVLGSGSATTTIDGEGNGNVVVLTADGVIFEGFTVTGSVLSGINGAANKGIYVRSESNIIRNNNCSGNQHGIYLDGVEGNNISSNELYRNTYGILIVGGHDNNIYGNHVQKHEVGGIYLSETSNNLVHNNTSFRDEKGIMLYWESTGNTLLGNTCLENSLVGIFMGSSNNILSRNRLVGGGLDGHAGESGTIHNSNTVNGKPIRFIRNQVGGTVPGGAGQIILYGCDGVTVENQNCSDTYNGIQIIQSTGILVQNNQCFNITNQGIYLDRSTDCTIVNNTSSSSGLGSYPSWYTLDHFDIYSYLSSGNLIQDNLCLSTGIQTERSNNETMVNNSFGRMELAAISIRGSKHISATGNKMVNGGFYIPHWGSARETWETLTIDTSNTLAGKPVRYLSGASNMTIPADTAQLILAGCSNITIQGLDFSDVASGITVGYSSDIVIRNINSSFNTHNGMYLLWVSRCSLLDNVCSNNPGSGIYLKSCDNVTASNNTCLDNGGVGISFTGNDYEATNNTCSGNNYGLWVRAERSVLTGNTCLFNEGSGINLQSCVSSSEETGNLVESNTCSFNGENGLRLWESEGIVITGNEFSFNGETGVWTNKNGDCVFSNNSFVGTDVGLRLYGGFDNTVRENTVRENNFSRNRIGLLVFGGNQIIVNNSFREDIFGAWFERGHDITFTANILQGCETGITLVNESWGNLFSGNNISGNEIGVHVAKASPDNVFTGNDIHDNHQWGINASGNGDYTVLATGNWWGHPAGPYHPSKNPYGQGNPVSDLVVFRPWDGIEGFFYRYVSALAAPGGNGSKEHPFTSIQDAIDSVPETGVVVVWDGFYQENPMIGKKLSLVGNGSKVTTIHGSWQGVVLDIKADWVNVSGFRVINSGDEYAGIRLFHSNNSQVFNNTCSDNFEGISVTSSSFTTVTGNNCSGNAVGLGLSAARSNHIVDNTLDLNRHGIFLSSAEDNLIQGNSCSREDYTAQGIYGTGSGIHLYSNNHNNRFIENNCSFNPGNGISCMASSDNIFTGNVLFGNKGTGLLVFASADLTIRGNFIENNTDGLSFNYRCENCQVDYNSITGNSRYGLNASENTNVSVSATDNWWGNETGPYHPVLNPNGTGNAISDSADFIPWLALNGTQTWPEPVSPPEEPGDEEPNDEEDDKDIWAFEVGLSTILGLLGLILLGSLASFAYSESHRFSFLEFPVSLYTRLSGDKIEHDIAGQSTRGQIYRFIEEVPGVSFGEARKKLVLGSGTMVYHLSVLQREGYIRSSVRGRQKLFWVKTDFPGISNASLSGLQKEIISLLEQEGELSRPELIEKTGVPRSTLHDNVNSLRKRGLVHEEERNGKKVCSLEKEV